MLTRRRIPQTAELLSLAFALVLVLAIGIFTYRAWDAFSRSNDQAAVARQVVDQTNALLSSLKDAETGQRGYLLTGEDRYLEPYLRARTEVPPALDRLAQLEAHQRSGEARRVERLRPLIKAKLDELEQTIELRRSQGLGAAQQIVRTDQGQNLMDQIRSLCAEIRAVTDNTLIREKAEARTSGNQAGLIAVLGSSLVFVFLLLATLTIRRGTERRQQLIEALEASEGRLRESRDWLQTTLRSIGDGVITTDAEGKITLLNYVAQSLTGWSQEEAAGKGLEEVFVIRHAETAAVVENPVTKVLSERRIVGLANHTCLTAKDGRRIAIDDTAAPIRDRSGTMAGVVLVFRDVTEKQAAERRLAEQTDELRRTAHLLERVSCFVRDLEDRIVYWNPGAADLYGYSSDEAKGRIAHELLKTEFPTPVDQIQAQVRTAGEWNGELLHTRRDGERVTVASRWALHQDAAGRPVAILEVNLDITERKEIERQLALVREQLAQELAGTRGLHELASRLMALDDLPALLNAILAAAETITGADKGNIQLLDSSGGLRIEAQHGFSQEFLDYFSGVGRGQGACGTALTRGQRIIVEDVERSAIFAGTPAVQVLLADGVRAVQATPIMSRAGAPIGVLSTYYRTPRQPNERDLRLIDLLARQAADLIERIRAEDALRVANAALSRANEDLNQFAFAASHDLQEPLRMITSYSQLLLRGYRGQLAGEAATCVEFITEGTRRMRDLLTGLLAYTRLNGKPQESIAAVDLNLVLEKTLANCQAGIEESRAEVTSDRLPTVAGYEPHFVQLFQNLIGNALKYRGERAPRIHVSAVKRDGAWQLAVADNGMGIAPQYQQEIFGVFKRLHGRAIAGTGIGLAICQRVVERYGGRIWVESQVNQGATFYFTLPAAKGAATHGD